LDKEGLVKGLGDRPEASDLAQSTSAVATLLENQSCGFGFQVAGGLNFPEDSGFEGIFEWSSDPGGGRALVGPRDARIETIVYPKSQTISGALALLRGPDIVNFFSSVPIFFPLFT
jgi:hypothetical protein